MNAIFDINREQDSVIDCMDLEDNAFGHHFHSHLEIALVLEGEIEVTINGLTRVLSKGCISVADSYDVHSYYTRTHSRIRLLIIPIDLARLPGSPFQSMTFSSSFLFPCGKTSQLEQAMAALVCYGKTQNNMTAMGHVLVILGLLTEELSLSPRLTESGSSMLTRDILMYLEQNYLTHITMEDLAHRYGYNKNYLSRLFHAQLGCGFLHYLNSRRAQYAARLMENVDLSLEEIAYQSGFRSLRTFNRAFQTCFQQTAFQYRKGIKAQK